MTSTIQLKLTYLIQSISILLMPILGILLALIIKVLATVFSFGYADEEFLAELSDPYLYIGFALGIIYLLCTIGIIKKSKIFRFLSILVNLAVATFFGYAGINSIASNPNEGSYTLLILALVYLFPIYTLLIHKKTTELF